jgi:hypothetical protein
MESSKVEYNDDKVVEVVVEIDDENGIVEVEDDDDNGNVEVEVEIDVDNGNEVVVVDEKGSSCSISVLNQKKRGGEGENQI